MAVQYFWPGEKFSLEKVLEAIDTHRYDPDAHAGAVDDHDHPFEEIVSEDTKNHSHYFLDLYTKYAYYEHGKQHIPFWVWQLSLRINTHELELFPHPNLLAYTLRPEGWANYPVGLDDNGQITVIGHEERLAKQRDIYRTILGGLR